MKEHLQSLNNENNGGFANPLKSLVSKQKNRFIMDGFDLDLTCTFLNLNLRYHWIGDCYGVSSNRLWSNL